MSNAIRSGNSSDELTIDPSSKAARITQYNSSGVEIAPLADSTLTARLGTLGQKVMAGSTPVVIASDQSAIPVTGSGTFTVSGAVTQSGTWTVQPGNTANTTPWLFTVNQGGNSATVSASGALKVDGSAVTQPVSGPLTDTQLRATPVPVSGTVTANIGTSGALALDATLTARLGVLGQAVMASSTPVVIASNQSAIPVSQSGTWNVNNISGAISLPTGAATETTLGGVLTSTNFQARINTLGQKTMANSTPVTLASDQSTLTVAGSGTFTVSGTVTANVGTTNGLALDATLAKLTVAQGTALGSNTQAMVGGSVTTAAPTYVTGQISPLSLTTAGALRTDASGSTQPVSGTVTANIGSSGSLALDATLTARLGVLGQAVMASSTPVVIASNQSAIPVSQSGTWNITNISGTISLPTGAAQEHVTAGSPNATRLTDGASFYDATKTGQLPSALVGGRLDTNIGTWLGSTTPTVGQKAMSASLPVVLASDQSTVTIAGTVTANLGSTGTLVTDANLDEKFGDLGQKAMSGSTPVVIASDQSAIPSILSDAQNNTTSQISPLRDLVIGARNRSFGDSFSDGIGVGEDAGVFPNPTVSGSGSFATTGGQLALETGATTGSTVTLQSNLTNVFRAGYSSGFQTGVQVPTTPSNFRVVSRNNSVDTQVAAASFNVVAGYSVDANFHQYFIVFQGSAAIFSIDGVAVHRMSGQVAAPRTATLDLPLRYEVVNAAGTTTVRWGEFSTSNGYFFEATYSATDVIMNIRGSSAFILGAETLSIGLAGNTAPVRVTAIGGSDGTNLRALSTDSTGKLTVNLGTTGTLVTDANLDEKFGDLGQKTMSGSTPVVLASDQSALTIAQTALPADSTPATQNITVQDTNSTTTAQQSNQNAVTGTPTAGSTALFTVANVTTGRFEITGTWTGTIVLEVSPDGVVWTTQGAHLTGTALQVGSFTSNAIGILNLAGAVAVRLRATAAMTGTATIKITLSNNVSMTYVANALRSIDGSGLSNQVAVKAASTAALVTDPAMVVAISPNNSVAVTGTFFQGTQPVSGTVTANIGSSGSLALDATLTGGTARSKITDGTNNAAVKAASTAAAAADPALVVAISPNNGVSRTVAAAATLTNVSSLATNVTLLAANANRLGAYIYHDSTAILSIKFGATASATSFTVKVQAAGFFEFPEPMYVGQVDGIWASANGAARMTEIT